MPNPGSLVTATTSTTPSPEPSPLIAETAAVLSLTSLKSVAQQGTQYSNLRQAAIVASTNLGSQNALASQQALNQLALAVFGKAANRIANLNPLEARCSVDVLTSDELASTLADLSAVVEAFAGSATPAFPIRPPNLKQALRNLIAMLKVLLANQSLTGSGTREDPYSTTGTIYFLAPTMIGFPNLKPDQVKLRVDEDGGGVSATGK